MNDWGVRTVVNEVVSVTKKLPAWVKMDEDGVVGEGGFMCLWIRRCNGAESVQKTKNPTVTVTDALATQV